MRLHVIEINDTKIKKKSKRKVSVPDELYRRCRTLKSFVPNWLFSSKWTARFVCFFPLSQVCFVNLDVNKDERRLDQLQQVTRTWALWLPITRPLPWWKSQHGGHFIHSPFPAFPCHLPKQFAFRLLVQLAFPRRQGYFPARYHLPVVFSALPFSTLKPWLRWLLPNLPEAS